MGAQRGDAHTTHLACVNGCRRQRKRTLGVVMVVMMTAMVVMVA
jgi:hypothetical protein